MQSSDPRLFARAVGAFQAGRYDEAERDFKKVLRVEPRHFGALSLYSVVLMQTARFAEAEPVLRKAANANPASDVTFYNHGLTLKNLKKPADALEAFNKAIALNPTNAESFNSRGTVLNELTRLDEAIADFDRALVLAPNYAAAFYNKGKSLFMSERYQEALANFDNANKLDPHLAEVWVGRGNLYTKLERHDEALAAFSKAIEIKRDLPEAWMGAGWTLKTLGRYDEALAAFRTAVQLQSDAEYVKGEILTTKMFVCAWDNVEKDLSQCMAEVRKGRPAVLYPFSAVALSNSPADQLKCASEFSRYTFRDNLSPMWQGERYSHDRIRVAYLTGDLREHPVAYLAAGVFEAHDRSRFETIAISLGQDDQSAIRNRLTKAFDRFVDARAMRDEEIARLLREMEVDIAVDLMGHTTNARLPILAWRPAPIQATYLGYPGTTGSKFIDYIIADGTVIPPEHQSYYSEKVACLPNCYLPNDRNRAMSTAPSRADAGLPETGFVFCSFNNAYKITPAIFDVWMRLLKRVDNSVLWLSALPAIARTNLLKEAERRGVNGDRIVFANRVTRQEDHLGRLQLADLFLDTLIYNAHTTACDALWAGVPLVTCLGSTFAGRVGASILKAVGLPELITASVADYETLALRLANTPDLLTSVRSKLSAQRSTSPLFDTPQFTRHIEAAYAMMWERSQRGETPEGFSVS